MLRLKWRRTPRYPFCPKCGAPWKNLGTRFVCPKCGYAKLTDEGKLEVREKLLSALERLLAGQRGNSAAVTLRKLARAAGLGELELRYAAYRWRKILPSLVEVDGDRWLYSLSESDRKRAIYVKETAPRRQLRGARKGVGA